MSDRDRDSTLAIDRHSGHAAGIGAPDILGRLL
jgi:hypothetical protein